MRNLINFILKNIHWLIFLLLVFISAFLIVNNNEYQRSKYLSVENEVIGTVYTFSDNVSSYIGLRTENQKLMDRIANQESLIQTLSEQLKEKPYNTTVPAFSIDSTGKRSFDFIAARVINNNISGVQNLMTLNKGSNDGIQADMGVLSLDGVVGVVIKVSSQYSVIIPILNPKFRLNCKVLKNNYSGPLVWNEKDTRYAFLEDFPKHVEFQIGDTVVTSGYSTIFPEGLPVGIIIDSKKQRNDNFNSLKIKLFTNFATLNTVWVVKKNNKEEQLQLEEISRNNVK